MDRALILNLRVTHTTWKKGKFHSAWSHRQIHSMLTKPSSFSAKTVSMRRVWLWERWCGGLQNHVNSTHTYKGPTKADVDQHIHTEHDNDQSYEDSKYVVQDKHPSIELKCDRKTFQGPQVNHHISKGPHIDNVTNASHNNVRPENQEVKPSTNGTNLLTFHCQYCLYKSHIREEIIMHSTKAHSSASEKNEPNQGHLDDG